jgi:hypothetical protein
MSKCANCGTTMSCGCQRRTLANGKQGCSKCISATGKSINSQTDPEVNFAELIKKDK